MKKEKNFEVDLRIDLVSLEKEKMNEKEMVRVKGGVLCTCAMSFEGGADPTAHAMR